MWPLFIAVMGFWLIPDKLPQLDVCIIIIIIISGVLVFTHILSLFPLRQFLPVLSDVLAPLIASGCLPTR